MASIYKIGTLLRTDGTNQSQRTPALLPPSAVAIEGRDLSDFIHFAYQIAQEVRYYNNLNIEDGDWSTFFDGFINLPAGSVKNLEAIEQELNSREDLPPHITLFITFLKLLEYQKVDINALTKAHLDYYYEQILKIEKKQAEPDIVHVLFELAKGTPSFLLKKGTKLDGGKDDKGNSLIYKTERDVVINQAAVASLKSLFIERKFSGTSIFKSEAANSADGLGAPLEDPSEGWHAFGEQQSNKSTDERNMADATVGFALASPQLLLKEGERIVVLNILLESATPILPAFSLAGSIDVFYTGEEGWVPVQVVSSQVFEETSDKEVRVESGDVTTTETFNTRKIVTSGSTSGQSNQNISGAPQIQIQYQQGPIADTRIQTYRTRLETVQVNGSSGPDSLTVQTQERRVLSIALQIGESEPAAVAFDDDLHEGVFQTQWPVIKVELKQGNGAYENMSQYLLRSAEVDVYVKGVRDLLLQNGALRLDNGGPFLPFGAQPSLDSTLYIGSAEVFQKKLKHLELGWTWKEPPALFSDHYQAEYTTTDGGGTIYGPVSNDSFQFELSYLYQKKWQETLTRTFNLFDSGDATLPNSRAFNSIVMNGFGQEVDYDRLEHLQELQAFNRASSKNGFVRMVLKGAKGPNIRFTAFGHKEFPRIYSQQAIALSRFTAGGGTGNEPPLPNEPYTPELEDLFLTYASVQQLELEGEADAFFSIGPFGNKKIKPAESETIIPQLPEESAFYIGLENLVPPQNVNFLFKLAEGTGAKELEPIGFSWSILAKNKWEPVNASSILIDSTDSFQRSGIISIALSREMTKDNSFMPSGQHWIKVSLAQNTAGVNRFIELKTQAVDASLELLESKEEALSDHLNNKLPAERIKQLIERKAAIKTITQPYSSFDGKAREDASNYYKRTSEYLRHKNRAITIWDYERLVLEEFPSIFKVKCLNHTRPDGLVAPGHITVIAVSNQKNDSLANPLQPRINKVMLDTIKDFLLPFTNFFFQQNPERLVIENPLYEQLLLDFKVAFYPGLDAGYYRNQLNEELRKFLSPWAYDEGQDIEFGGRIHKSDLMAFVESRSYVDYVTDFKLYHIFDSENEEIPQLDTSIIPEGSITLSDMSINTDFIVGIDIELAQAVSPRSILVSFPEHRITVVEEGDVVCQGIDGFGLGQMIVGIDFEVGLETT